MAVGTFSTNKKKAQIVIFFFFLMMSPLPPPPLNGNTIKKIIFLRLSLGKPQKKGRGDGRKPFPIRKCKLGGGGGCLEFHEKKIIFVNIKKKLIFLLMSVKV